MSRPTHPLITAALAVVLVAGGAGLAIATGATKQAPTDAVACVGAHDSLVLADNGTCATQDTKARIPLTVRRGPKGAPGSAVGYTTVRADVVKPAESKNVPTRSLSHPGTGVYCFNHLPFTVHNAMVGIINDPFVNPVIYYSSDTADLAGIGCATGTDFAVAIDTPLTRSSVSPTDAQFSVLFN